MNGEEFHIAHCVIPGARLINPSVHLDERGRFVKIVHAGAFCSLGMAADFVEVFYSTSESRVLRGLHLQIPPADCDRLVTCVAGEVFDVIVDLRQGSPTYARHEVVVLSAERANAIYVPRGVAHGFEVMGSGATVLYAATHVHDPLCDTGVHWASAGIAWPHAEPVVSARDARLPRLQDFDSPFLSVDAPREENHG